MFWNPSFDLIGVYYISVSFFIVASVNFSRLFLSWGLLQFSWSKICVSQFLEPIHLQRVILENGFYRSTLSVFNLTYILPPIVQCVCQILYSVHFLFIKWHSIVETRSSNSGVFYIYLRIFLTFNYFIVSIFDAWSIVTCVGIFLGHFRRCMKSTWMGSWRAILFLANWNFMHRLLRDI